MISLVLDPILKDYRLDEEDLIKDSKDYDYTLYICEKIKYILENKNIKINLTRYDEKSISIEEKLKIFKENEADLIISIDFNDLINVKTSEIQSYYNIYDDGIDYLAKSLCDNISSKIKINNKGIKKYDLYSMKDDIIPSITIKFNISNSEIMTIKVKDIIAEQIKCNLENYFNIGTENNNKVIENDFNNITKILSVNNIDKNQAKTWAKNKGATNNFIALADYYWDLCDKCGGVNPVVAYAQAAYETAYGHFKGEIKEEFKNLCGFKNEVKNKSESKIAYINFSSWADGIEAHLDHLALYAGAEGYPKEKTKDPKHLSYLYNMITYAEDLSKNWSPKVDYGVKISNLCKEIYKTTKTPDVENIKIRKFKEIEEIKSEHIESFKDKLKNVNLILDNLKNYNNGLYDLLEKIQNYIENVEKEKEILVNNNTELNTQIDKSKQLVSDMKGLINLIIE